MVNFIIPGMYEHHKINIVLCALMKLYPEMFYEDINISSVYGNFQFCTWDGGRIFQEYNYITKEEMETIIKIYNDLGVRVRYVFTNPIIEESDLFDRFNNLALILGETPDKFNEVVVNSPLLEAYIEKNYPNYNFISSTTKCLSNIEDAKNEINNPKYSMVCLDYNLNKNKKLLNSLSYDERSKVEFLVNAICPPGCPFRKNHYKLNGVFGKTYGKRYAMRDCLVKGSTVFPNNYTNNLNIDDIYEYHKEGFFYYKLEGRSVDIYEIVFNYLSYFVKPEYYGAVGRYLFVQSEKLDLNNFNLNYFKICVPR